MCASTSTAKLNIQEKKPNAVYLVGSTGFSVLRVA